MSTWPNASLDAVARLRVVASALPGVGLVETTFDAPFAEVWARIEDLEHTVPAFDRMVASLRIDAKDGERWQITTTAPILRIRNHFDVEMRAGWCLMRSSRYLVGIAAVPDAGDASKTRYAQFEGPPWRWLPRSIMRPLFGAVVADDVRGLRRLLSR